MFSLSNLTLMFDDESDNNWNWQKVLERLSQAELPPNLEPEIGADFSPAGEIYLYTSKASIHRTICWS
jgi:heavy metal efflux system protein